MDDTKLKEMKAWLYPVSGIVGWICSTVILIFAMHYETLYSVLIGAGFGFAFFCIARVVLHLNQDDNSAEMWQVAIYHALAVTGWFIFVQAEGWGIATFGMALVVGATIMCLFSRFLKTTDITLLKMINEDRWYPKEGTKEADQTKPICCIKGECLTIAEALAKGYTKEAEEAKENLKAYLNNNSKKKEKKEEGK